jgi:misacylated tRNA(Ala) deacylase
MLFSLLRRLGRRKTGTWIRSIGQRGEEIAMQTCLLYHTDAYLREFTATVVGAEGNAVALDATAFYPGGGGQLADRGTLRWDGTDHLVTALAKRDDVVWHTVAGTPPEVGTSVSGAIDWEFRYQMMRTHTALHILCGTIFRDFGAQVTGGQMYPDRARMDFALDGFDSAMLHALEERINAAVSNDLPIKVYTLSREQAFQIPDLIRTKINLLPAEITEIRIVEIVGLDLQADGGTHVASTREVGGIKIVKTENKGKANKRLEIIVTPEPVVAQPAR